MARCRENSTEALPRSPKLACPIAPSFAAVSGMGEEKKRAKPSEEEVRRMGGTDAAHPATGAEIPQPPLAAAARCPFAVQNSIFHRSRPFAGEGAEGGAQEGQARQEEGGVRGGGRRGRGGLRGDWRCSYLVKLPAAAHGGAHAGVLLVDR